MPLATRRLTTLRPYALGPTPYPHGAPERREQCRILYCVLRYYYYFKLAAPKGYHYLATFFSIRKNIRLFASKNGWGMLVYAPGWSLCLASFEVLPPPQVRFSAAKK